MLCHGVTQQRPLTAASYTAHCVCMHSTPRTPPRSSEVWTAHALWQRCGCCSAAAHAVPLLLSSLQGKEGGRDLLLLLSDSGMLSVLLFATSLNRCARPLTVF